MRGGCLHDIEPIGSTMKKYEIVRIEGFWYINRYAYEIETGQWVAKGSETIGTDDSKTVKELRRIGGIDDE